MGRIYESAWKKLKSNPSDPLVISAHPALHRRIYKAIVKEKWMDTLYHIEQDFNGFRTRLSHRSEGNALIITLHSIPTDLHHLF